MPHNQSPSRAIARQGITTVGIDVGGERKGFHAVAMTDGVYAAHHSAKDAQEIGRWCRETVRARVIAIDAPCRWSLDGRSRPAERELIRKGILCFSTPTRDNALNHPRNYFGWMLQGEALFQELETDFPLCRELPISQGRCCFETFPHAITWHFQGGHADARLKRYERRGLLERAGTNSDALRNIDLVDAALCALTAFHAASGAKCLSFGEPETGLIIVPSSR
ncbi:MAG: DUF429 domain-containing protein [Terrimicrobiaceae bacterium]